MNVADMESLYPYLAGHTYIRPEGSRSFSCALCGCFRDEHALDKRGSTGNPLAQVHGVLAEINERDRGQ